MPTLSAETQSLITELEAERQALEVLFNPPEAHLQPKSDAVRSVVDKLTNILSQEQTEANRQLRITQLQQAIEVKSAKIEELRQRDQAEHAAAFTTLDRLVAAMADYNAAVAKAEAALAKVENLVGEIPRHCKWLTAFNLFNLRAIKTWKFYGSGQAFYAESQKPDHLPLVEKSR